MAAATEWQALGSTRNYRLIRLVAFQLPSDLALLQHRISDIMATGMVTAIGFQPLLAAAGRHAPPAGIKLE